MEAPMGRQRRRGDEKMKVQSWPRALRSPPMAITRQLRVSVFTSSFSSVLPLLMRARDLRKIEAFRYFGRNDMRFLTFLDIPSCLTLFSFIFKVTASSAAALCCVGR